MNDPELEKLASLWQEPDEAESEAYEALARKARRQARLSAYADVAMGAVVVIGLAVGALMKPSLGVGLLTILLLAGLVWLNVKRRSIRQMVKTIDASDRADFLEGSRKIAVANLRRVTLSLLTFPPFVLAALVYRVLEKGPRGAAPLATLRDWALSSHGLIVLPVLAMLVVSLIRSRKQFAAELRGLDALREQYRLEEEWDAREES